MSAIVKLDDIGVVFPPVTGGQSVHALEKINLEFAAEEFVVALGSSGCGKTTLLNVIAGFISPTFGQISRMGEPVVGPGRDRGVVFQKHALFPEFGLKLQGVGRTERRRIAREYLSLVGLSEFEDYPVYQLSGGMQQRVGLARALTTNPEMLLMDEPLGALDAFTRENMQELVLKVWKKTRKIIFFITHSVEEALFMATRLIVMSPRPGRITHEYNLEFSAEYFETGDARKIKSAPKFIEVREEVLSIIYGEEV